MCDATYMRRGRCWAIALLYPKLVGFFFIVIFIVLWLPLLLVLTLLAHYDSKQLPGVGYSSRFKHDSSDFLDLELSIKIIKQVFDNHCSELYRRMNSSRPRWGRYLFVKCTLPTVYCVWCRILKNMGKEEGVKLHRIDSDQGTDLFVMSPI